MLRQLVHNGVVVPPAPEYHNLILTIRGQQVRLTPAQEEMALAWARKQGTPYVEDATFVRNFLADFSEALGIKPPLKADEVDFGPAIEVITQERQAREALSKEERKELAAQRKAARELLREQYGHATVDGARTELGTYLVEPSGIFMGRGKHPLRGRWKPGPTQRDITLNLSPDAPTPPGDWAGRVWEPASLWIARWKDRLSGKTKYIWLADTAPIKQDKEARKFDKATELSANLEAVRAHICAGLEDNDPWRRRVATAAYLIDILCLRVGDEKDPDEADTVGATTLRPEHVILRDDGKVEFRFLGKDSVEWHKVVPLPEVVRRNLEELRREARPSRNGRESAAGDRPQLFPDVSSRDVNAFLGEALPGLTAKVFRTRHATAAVAECLARSPVSEADAEYRKRAAAAEANLAAATLCNHYKKAPANWSERQARVRERRQALQQRLTQAREELKAAKTAEAALREEARTRQEAAKGPKARERIAASWRKRLEKARQKVEAQRARVERAEEALARFDAQARLSAKCRTWNLGTSLKSYIDPRVYEMWGRRVAYDVLSCYYPKTLQNKFAWARRTEESEGEQS